ncbi:MAG: DUF3536 domain-containing protein [Bernardetiaceae bacterium]
MPDRYLCVHGHFYQPPRQNAWLGEIERQPSAAPFHNWNERITSECYYANAYSRILNEQDKIVAITNNYARMSFNFGPTLLQWLEREQPYVYSAILTADRQSQDYFDGHGSAIAQVYNHLIMPLANRRDKETQVRWGIQDFQYRFGRYPEGMWLAETAVDIETLEVLAENDIKFTILAPSQCKHIRKIGTVTWENTLDTRRPYRCNLPSGHSIAIFFYDGERSQSIAFKGLLNDGKRFAHSLLSGFTESQDPQLVHVATDGESYGHHHRYGDMALAYCMHYIESNKLAKITNYAAFLKMFPPSYEAEIHPNSSWSCAHGIERWRSDCGCSTGGQPGWNQAWRKPLRQGLDELRDKLASVYEKEIQVLVNQDAWKVREAYLSVILGQISIDTFWEHYRTTHSFESDRKKFIYLLEMQHHALLMFTSCAWFFDDISRIETVQVLQYARRAIQLAERITNTTIESHFLTQLKAAISNLTQEENGASVYRRYVLPAQFDLTKAGMHYAAERLLSDYASPLQLPNYQCELLTAERLSLAAQRLLYGQVWVRSRITTSETIFHFALLYLGDHHIIGRSYMNKPDYKKIESDFKSGNILAFVASLKNQAGEDFSFFDLRPDAQKSLLDVLTRRQVQSTYEVYERIHQQSYNLLNLLKNSQQEIPALLRDNLKWALHYELEKIFLPCPEEIDLQALKKITARFQKWNILPDATYFNFFCTERLLCMIPHLQKEQGSEQTWENVAKALLLLRQLHIFPALKRLQNSFYLHGRGRLPDKIAGVLFMETK